MSTWTIDPAHTQVEFSVKHLMISKVRGNFNSFSGTITLDEQELTNSRAEGSIDASSVNTREPNRDAHLRSADFFDVESHPTLDFRSTSVEAVGGGHYKVHGDLTIRGITKAVTLDITEEGRGSDPWGGQRIAFSAKTALNRKDFGLNWNAVLETGGFVVSDEVQITIEGEAVQQQAQPASEAAG